MNRAKALRKAGEQTVNLLRDPCADRSPEGIRAEIANFARAHRLDNADPATIVRAAILGEGNPGFAAVWAGRLAEVCGIPIEDFRAQAASLLSALTPISAEEAQQAMHAAETIDVEARARAFLQRYDLNPEPCIDAKHAAAMLKATDCAVIVDRAGGFDVLSFVTGGGESKDTCKHKRTILVPRRQMNLRDAFLGGLDSLTRTRGRNVFRVSPIREPGPVNPSWPRVIGASAQAVAHTARGLVHLAVDVKGDDDSPDRLKNFFGKRLSSLAEVDKLVVEQVVNELEENGLDPNAVHVTLLNPVNPESSHLPDDLTSLPITALNIHMPKHARMRLSAEGRIAPLRNYDPSELAVFLTEQAKTSGKPTVTLWSTGSSQVRPPREKTLTGHRRPFHPANLTVFGHAVV